MNARVVSHQSQPSPQRPRRTAVMIVGVLLASLAGGVALAKSDKRAKEEAELLQNVSRESAQAMHDIRAARLALFEGQPDAAKALVADAKKNLSEAEKNAPRTRVTVKTERTLKGKTIAKSEQTETADLVPIDAWLEVAEDFVSTPAQDESIATANEHMKAGDRDRAVETLKAADVELAVTRVLMPVGETEAQVTKAAKLLDDEHFYQANLALKAAEDGLVSDTVVLDAPTASVARS